MTNGPRRDEPGWYLVVDPGSDGIRLDRFLAGRIERLSRARAARLDVFDLDAQTTPLKKSVSVRAGQRLWARRPIPDPGVSPEEPKIIYEDESILVLNKPPGLAVHPSASRFLSTITYWLSKAPRFDTVKPSHRLDVETSGVLICARPPLHGTISALFAEHVVEKCYLAVIDGVPSVDEWVIDTPLGFDQDCVIRLKMARGDLPAKTRFRVRQRGATRCLVEAYPVTGRQHQIRVHAQLSGYPLVGDKLYGPEPDLFIASRDRELTATELARLGHSRHALHAWKIILPLPNRELEFTAPLPDDLRCLLNINEGRIPENVVLD